MAEKQIPHPTDRELEILSILWEKGPSTVREVNDQMNKISEVGYTTTLKLMQLMTQKGLLFRNKSKYRHIYEPVLSEAKTQIQLIANMLKKAFAGSATKLVMRAISSNNISKDEMDEIKKLVNKMGKK